MSQFCIHISDAQHSHEWGYSPTVGTYTCMKCSERRNYNDPQYAEAEREYQAQVRNMQQSSDMVLGGNLGLSLIDKIAIKLGYHRLIGSTYGVTARAILEASHHAELVAALKPFAALDVAAPEHREHDREHLLPALRRHRSGANRSRQDRR